MFCLYCHRRIGLLRKLTDGEYCSQEHRIQMRTQSARALRNSREYDGFDDYDSDSTVFVKPIHDVTSSAPARQSSTTSTATFGLLLIAGIFVATFGVTDQGGSRALPRRASNFAPMESIRQTIRSYATVKLQDDFKSGLQSWKSTGSAGHDWSFKDGFVRPAKLRIWSDSLRLKDYQVEFVGEIQQKGLSWAYRAKDGRNYYANKIVITKPGPLPAANLVRYAMLNGEEKGRHATPLNMTLRTDTLYRVHMSVKGSDFTTTVNGQMVDTWSDDRLKSGGVGFFADEGELASLRYVQVTDKDTVLGRLLSYIGMLRPLTPLP
jgi:hypothetical protein